MDLTVLHDRVVIKKIEPEAVTKGGLVLPGAVDPTFEATVLAVGTGKPIKDAEPIPLTVKPGDRVMYDPKSTIAVKVNGEDLLVIKEENIFAIMGEDADK